MKTYSVYDNTDGGYTIWYQHYDNLLSRYVKRNKYAYNKSFMLSFTKDLEKNGYRFVGKIK